MNPKIKTIYIQVPFYDFSSKDADIFIGRKSAGENLKRRLLPSKKKDVKYSGAYLVAGFRGMGKTKLVSQTIEARFEHCRTRPSRIAQPPIRSRGSLRQSLARLWSATSLRSGMSPGC